MKDFHPTDEQLELCDQVCKWFHDYESGHRIRSHPQWYSYSGAAGVGISYNMHSRRLYI